MNAKDNYFSDNDSNDFIAIGLQENYALEEKMGKRCTRSVEYGKMWNAFEGVGPDDEERIRDRKRIKVPEEYEAKPYCELHDIAIGYLAE